MRRGPLDPGCWTTGCSTIPVSERVYSTAGSVKDRHISVVPRGGWDASRRHASGAWPEPGRRSGGPIIRGSGQAHSAARGDGRVFPCVSGTARWGPPVWWRWSRGGQGRLGECGSPQGKHPVSIGGCEGRTDHLELAFRDKPADQSGGQPNPRRPHGVEGRHLAGSMSDSRSRRERCQSLVSGLTCLSRRRFGGAPSTEADCGGTVGYRISPVSRGATLATLAPPLRALTA